MDKVSSQESKRVETSAQVRDWLWQVCPPQAHDNRKSWLARAARTMGWGQRRTKALFYCEARVITADEWRTLNERFDALKSADRQHRDETNELHATLRTTGDVRLVDGGMARRTR